MRRNLNVYLYYFYFIVRRLLFILTMIYLPDYPTVQVTITWIHTLAFLAWVVNMKPFAKSEMNWLAIYSEIMTCLVFAELSLYLWD